MKVLDMFRSGLDTYEIAKRRGVRESVIYDMLHKQREAERLMEILRSTHSLDRAAS